MEVDDGDVPMPEWLPKFPDDTARVVIVRVRKDDTIELVALGMGVQRDALVAMNLASLNVLCGDPPGHVSHWSCIDCGDGHHHGEPH